MGWQEDENQLREKQRTDDQERQDKIREKIELRNKEISKFWDALIQANMEVNQDVRAQATSEHPRTYG